MAVILMIESSTEVCSVAISKDGQCLYHTESHEPNCHTSLLTILIKKCLSEVSMNINDMDALSFSNGPGSYTSLRVGASTVKGICYASSCPLIILDSLSILAAGIQENLHFEDIIIPMIDARRLEVYAAVYDSDRKMIDPIQSIVLDQLSFSSYNALAHEVHLCGNGIEKYHLHFPNKKHVLHHKITSASFMSQLSFQAYKSEKFADVAYFTPNYMKLPNITTSTKTLF